MRKEPHGEQDQKWSIDAIRLPWFFDFLLVWIEKPALRLSLIVSFASTKTNIYWTIGAEKFANPLVSICQFLRICEISR